MLQKDKTFRKYVSSKQTLIKGELYKHFKNLKDQVIF